MVPYVQGRRLAVSTTLVHGCLADAAPAAQVAQEFLATQRPVGPDQHLPHLRFHDP